MILLLNNHYPSLKGGRGKQSLKLFLWFAIESYKSMKKKCFVIENLEVHRPQYSDFIWILTHRNQVFTKHPHLFYTLKNLNKSNDYGFFKKIVLGVTMIWLLY